MDVNFIRDRITQLRIQRDNISESKMSRELGHASSYINKIVSGKSLPSFEELFNICDYFDVSVASFFDQEIKNPILVDKVIEELRQLNDSDLITLLSVIERFKQNN